MFSKGVAPCGYGCSPTCWAPGRTTMDLTLGSQLLSESDNEGPLGSHPFMSCS